MTWLTKLLSRFNPIHPIPVQRKRSSYPASPTKITKRRKK